jgi:hypothetical protein
MTMIALEEYVSLLKAVEERDTLREQVDRLVEAKAAYRTKLREVAEDATEAYRICAEQASLTSKFAAERDILQARVNRVVALYGDRCNAAVHGCSDEEEVFLADLIEILDPAQMGEVFSTDTFVWAEDTNSAVQS